MAFKIVTDSASDMLPAEAAKLGITIVPMTLTWDGTEYRDGYDITQSEFFTRLESSDTLPTTSQVTPAAFGAVFDSLAADGSELLVITISSVLSGTYQSAVLAAEKFGDRVRVIDSMSATIGEKLLVMSALEYMKSGMTLQQAAEALENDKNCIKVLAKVDTLEYLKRGGRISAVAAFAGGLLAIKPVVTVQDGAVCLIGKARGSKNANNLLRHFVDEAGGIDFSRPFFLAYSGLSGAQLQQYIDDSRDMWTDDVSTLPITTIGPVIGTHLGPGALGIAFFAKQ